GQAVQLECAHGYAEDSVLPDRENHSWRAASYLPDMKIQPANRRLGILLSGRGSNFEAIADNIASRKLNAEIAVVISNVESAPGLARAKARGLNTVFIPSQKRPREDFDREAVEVLKANNVCLVILAGFMRIFSRVFLEAYPYGI